MLGNICKYIHLVVRFTAVASEKVDTTCTHRASQDLVEVHKAIKSAAEKNLDPLGLKKKAVASTQAIASLIEQCSDTDILQSINSQLSSIIGLIKCHNEQKMPELLSTSPHARAEPANKKITPQKLFSTSKRKKSSKVRLARPTPEVRQVIGDKLQNNHILYTTLETAQGMCMYKFMCIV